MYNNLTKLQVTTHPGQQTRHHVQRSPHADHLITIILFIFSSENNEHMESKHLNSLVIDNHY